MNTPPDTIERIIRDLEHESHEAFPAGDTETVDRIFADGYIFTDSDGRISTKSDWRPR